MGSFSEVVLKLPFAAAVPDHVLAAFSGLPTGTRWPGDVPPPLPDPFSDDGTDAVWEPTIEDWGPDGVPPRSTDPEPWRHDWAGWVSRSMSVHIVPHAQIAWQAGHWTVTCRWGIKSWPTAIFPALAWLGPYLQPADRAPRLLGHIDGELDFAGPRPLLLWHYRGRIHAEDLNPPLDDIYQDPSLARWWDHLEPGGGAPEGY